MHRTARSGQKNMAMTLTVMTPVKRALHVRQGQGHTRRPKCQLKESVGHVGPPLIDVLHTETVLSTRRCAVLKRLLK